MHEWLDLSLWGTEGWDLCPLNLGVSEPWWFTGNVDNSLSSMWCSGDLQFWDVETGSLAENLHSGGYLGDARVVAASRESMWLVALILVASPTPWLEKAWWPGPYSLSSFNVGLATDTTMYQEFVLPCLILTYHIYCSPCEPLHFFRVAYTNWYRIGHRVHNSWWLGQGHRQGHPPPPPPYECEFSTKNFKIQHCWLP